MKEIAPKDNPSTLKGLDTGFLLFNLAYSKLQSIPEEERTYQQGRIYLCRILHLNKLEARHLLLAMSKRGMIRIKRTGELILKEEVESHKRKMCL